MDCKSLLGTTIKFLAYSLFATAYDHVDRMSERTAGSQGVLAWNDSAMFKNHTNRSHTTEAATEVLGEDVTGATESITNGSTPHRNLSTLPRDCSPAQDVVPEAGEGAAANGSVSHSTRESTVPSLKSRPSQYSFDSRKRVNVSKLQSELQEAAPRTYTILLSVEWDVTRLSDSEFSELVGVFYEEAAPRIVRRFRDWGLADAEDVVQNIFLTILRSNGRGRREVMDFLMIVNRAKSRFLSAIKGQTVRARRQVPLCDRIKETVGVVNREIERHGLQDEMEKVMKSLKPSHRDVLQFQYLGDLSQAEVGIAMGRSTDAIKSLASRARKKAIISLLSERENSRPNQNPSAD